MPKAVNHSGFYDKHNCPQRDSIPGPRALQSGMLPLDHDLWGGVCFNRIMHDPYPKRAGPKHLRFFWGGSPAYAYNSQILLDDQPWPKHFCDTNADAHLLAIANFLVFSSRQRISFSNRYMFGINSNLHRYRVGLLISLLANVLLLVLLAAVTSLRRQVSK